MRRKKILSQDPIFAHIESLSHDGRGIATIEGKKAFIFGALPGEKVSFKLTASKKGYSEGDLIEVISETSPLRVTPPCVHFGQCGGCNLQHLNVEAALAHKESVVLDNLLHMGKVSPEVVLPAISGLTQGYRRKARLGVRYVIKKEALLVGFRERSSNRVALMDSCKILDPQVGELITPLKGFIRELEAFESIAQIEVAIGDNVVALIIRHMNALSDQDQNAFINFAKRYESMNLAIYLQPKGPDTVYKLYPETTNTLLDYSLELPDEMGGQIHFQFHPLDFIQVNALVNQKMIMQALHLLDCQSTDKVLDLFCGLGNFTLPIAKKAALVVGVEGAQSSIVRAKGNAKLNNLDNTQFYVKDLTKPRDAIDEVWTKTGYNKILLDPPRTGAKEIVEDINRYNAKTIVYISCNPATLARDAGILVHQQGYTLKNVCVIDMFPHTAHVETMAFFQRE